MSPTTEALRFDVLAADKASTTFRKVADAVGDVTDEMRKLDRADASPSIDIDTRRAEQRIDRFSKNLRKKVTAAVAALPDVEIDADSSGADREIAQVRKDLQALRDVEIRTDVDAARAEAKLRELGARLARLNAESVDITVKADTLAATKALSSIKLDAIKLDVDTSAAGRQVGAFAADIRRRVEGAIKTLPALEITADSSDADREIAAIRDELASLSDREIGVDIDADEADERLRRLSERLERLSRSTADVRVRTDADAAARSLRKVSDEVDALDGRTAVVRVRTDRSILDSVDHITRLGSAMARIAIPAALIVGTPALISLGGAAATAAGSMLLLPAAANAAGLAVATVVTAFSGFGDAVGDDPEKAAEAIAKLTPAAQGAARAVNALKPALSDIRKSVQEAFFDGLGPQIGALGTTYLPLVSAAMTRVATQFNVAGGEVLQFLNHSATVGTVRDSFTSLGTVVGNLAPALLPLTSVMVDVGTVGAKVLADITGGAEDAATSFASMVSRARESGQMEAAIRRGLDELRRFGQLAGNVGGILGAMYRAGQASGNDFLGTLVDVTGRMREFLSSAQGQTAMIGIFTGINSAVTALLPGLEAVGSALGQIVTNKATSGALTAIAGAFSDLLVAAAPVVVAFANLVSAGIRPMAAALSVLAPVIGPIVAGLLAMKAATSTLKFLAAATGLRTLGSAALAVSGQMRGAAASTTAAGVAVAGTGTKVAAAGGRFAQARASAASLGASLPLVGLAFAGTAAYVTSTTVSLGDAVTAMNQGGAAADLMRQKVEAQTMGLGENAAGFDFGFAAVSNWARSNILGVATVDTLNKSLEEQKRQHDATAAASANAAGITRSSFDQITGSMDRSKKAAQQVTDNLQMIGPALSGIKNGVVPTQEMQGALDATAGAARGAAQEAGSAAQRLGGVGAGADAAARSMQASRDAFIQTATGAGMTEQAAGDLANKLGLIPDTARTDFRTNAATAAMEVQQVADKIRAVPPGHTITMNAMTDAAKGQLDAIGLTVKTMPDGTVQVTADTREAQANLDMFLRGGQERRTEVQIDGQTMPAQNALSTVLGQIAAGRSQVNIDGNSYPAQQVLSYLLGTVGGARGEVQLGANKAPADMVLAAYLAAVQSGSPTVTINGNSYPADMVLAALEGNIGTPASKPVDAAIGAAQGAVDGLHGTATAPATKPVDADNTGGLSAVDLLHGSAEAGATKPVDANVSVGANAVAGLQGSAQAGATKPVTANTGSAAGSVRTLQGSAEAGATKPVNADTARAQGAVNTLRRLAAASVTMVVNVVKRFFGSEGGIVPATGFADGGIHTVRAAPRVAPMADGGVGDPMSFAGHRLTPMSANTPKIVGANTWRVIGDRASGDELFLPLVPNNAMSQTLLEAGAARMGRELVPQDARLVPSSTGLQVAPMAAGGMTVRSAVGSAAPWLDAVRAQVQAAQLARAATPQVTVRAGMDVTELRAVVSQLVGLRADLAMSGRWGPEMVEQLRGLSHRLLADVSATARAAAGRDLASMGSW